MRFFIFNLAVLASAAPAIGAGTVWERPAWNGRIEEAAFSADATKVAARLSNGCVVIRDLAGAAAPVVHDCAPFAATRVAISADGARAAWGDYMGNLHTWSRANGIKESLPKRMALHGLTLTPDGASVLIAGDGVDVRILSAATHVQSYGAATSLGGVGALAATADLGYILAGDHDGKVTLLKKSGTTYSSSSKSPSSMGIRGAAVIPGTTPVFAVWDSGGKLFLLNSALATLATLDLGTEQVTAAHVATSPGQVLLGTASGKVFTVDTAARTLAGPVTDTGEAVVGMATGAGQELLLLCADGNLLAYKDGILAARESAALRGEWVDAKPSLQAGSAIIRTGQEVLQVNLATAMGSAVSTASDEAVIDAALVRRGNVTIVTRIVATADGLFLRASAGSGIAELALAGEPHSILSAGLWSPRLALASARGGIDIVGISEAGFTMEQSFPPEPGSIWTAAEFTDGDRLLVMWGRGRARLIDLVTGTSTLHPLGEDLIPSKVTVDPVTRVISYASGSAVNRAAAGDGPFTLTLAAGGPLTLERDGAHPLSAAFPAIVPLSAGGMDTGYFGAVQAARDAWMLHREFGWAWVVGTAAIDWCWWPGEGWTAGSESLGPYLYSHDTANWLFTLMPAYASSWVYDYAAAGWRTFGGPHANPGL